MTEQTQATAKQTEQKGADWDDTSAKQSDHDDLKALPVPDGDHAEHEDGDASAGVHGVGKTNAEKFSPSIPGGPEGSPEAEHPDYQPPSTGGDGA
jgi:hypothetical protein